MPPHNVVLTLGTFDLFHTGHVNLLARCRMLAGTDGMVAVALNRDDFIEAYKGHPPVIRYEDRVRVVAACKYVDRVLCNMGGRDAKPAIEAIGPNIIAVGSDWQSKDYYGQLDVTQAWLDGHRVRVEYLPYTTSISSSQIRARL